MTRSRRRKPISSQPLDLNRRRLGVVIPVMNMGGVERWAATLLRSIENVDIVGVLATSDGEFAMSMKKVAPIWNRRDASRFFDQCDDVIAWTWEDHMLDRLRDFDGRVILVSHGASTGDWSRSICRMCAVSASTSRDGWIRPFFMCSQTAPDASETNKTQPEPRAS